MQITRRMMPPVALAAALGLYGAASAPAPPGVGLVEAAIALLLLAGTGWFRPLALGSGALVCLAEARRLERVAAPAFVLLFWVPLVRGLVLDWGGRDVLRDVVPLIYLFLPALLVPRLRPAGAAGLEILAGGLALAGVFYTLRWWDEVGWGFGAVGQRAMSDGRLYFLNSPSVLFAALWLPIRAVRLAGGGQGMVGRGLALLLLLAGALSWLALAGTVHRAALVLGLGSALLFGVWWTRRQAAWPLLTALAVLCGLALFWPGGPLTGTVEQVRSKSELVGWNARTAEVDAVFDQVGRSPAALLFGDGWGTLIANPAVGGWLVSYTHSFPSYLLLKTGLLGTMAMIAWLATLLPHLVRLVRENPPLACAALPPLAIGFALHTSFKYLCFGLLLSLAVLAGDQDR
jgi:hypothetical protein